MHFVQLWGCNTRNIGLSGLCSLAFTPGPRPESSCSTCEQRCSEPEPCIPFHSIPSYFLLPVWRPNIVVYKENSRVKYQWFKWVIIFSTSRLILFSSRSYCYYSILTHVVEFWKEQWYGIKYICRYNTVFCSVSYCQY